ncbi:MAG: cell wall-binding repeat-containing protein [Candidatus Nanoperiomorbaceae bacterium]
MKKAGLATAALVSGIALSLAVGPAIASAATLPDNSTARIWGNTRADTSVLASNQLTTDGVSSTSSEVFVVGGQAFPDPLAVTPLAAQTKSHVLVTAGPDTLDQTVVDQIKALGAKRITVLGGPLAVSDSVVAQLKADFTGSRVTRVAGDTRYETAYYLAAYADAAYNGNYNSNANSPLKLRDNVTDLQDAEAAYQAALTTWVQARDDYANKLAAVQSIRDQISALQGQIVDLTAQLKTTAGLAQAQQDLVNAKTALDGANAALVQANQDHAFLTGLGTQTTTTLDIKSTLGEYRALLSSDDKATLTKVQQRLGISDATTLENAINASNSNVQTKTTAQANSSQAFATAVNKVTTLVANDAANQSVYAQISALQDQVNTLNGQLTPAVNALNTARDALVKAQVDLAVKTLVRPAPGALEKAQAALATALDNAVKGAGNRSVFLGDGTKFADPLVAGPAAFHTQGVVLLSDGSSLDSWTSKYLQESSARVVAVGVPAANAVGNNSTIQVANTFAGQTRYDTAAAVTTYYFTQVQNHVATSAPLAIASGEVFPDAVIGGNFIANYSGGVLLTQKSEVPLPTRNYLKNIAGQKTPVRVFGGPLVLDDSIIGTINGDLSR